MPGTTVVVILAAGAGSRFRDGAEDMGHKLSVKLSKTPRSGLPDPANQYANPSANPSGDAPTVLESALGHALDAGVGPVVVVTGAAPDIVPARFAGAVTIVHHPGWEAGQMTSLHVGLAAARRLDADAVVVGLGDQPFIEPDAWRTVAVTDAPIAVATYGGRRGNPVRLAAEVWDLLPADGDEGARVLMRVRPDLVREVPCTGSPDDIDTTEDLRRWQNS